jgi:hypothetical protein
MKSIGVGFPCETSAVSRDRLLTGCCGTQQTTKRLVSGLIKPGMLETRASI